MGCYDVFWGKTGSETNIPVVRHISSGRRQVSLPVAFLRVLSAIARLQLLLQFIHIGTGLARSDARV